MFEKNKKNIVTIDGPAGVGKSTVSRSVATVTGYTYLDTGAMYRGVGFYLDKMGIDLSIESEVLKCLSDLHLQILPAADEKSDVGVVVNNEDVTDIIRTPAMAMIASKVSAIPVVREKLTEMQRELGNSGNIVAEGRDVGTVVFPTARYKFFLDAKPEERARRRVDQLQDKGTEVDYEEILAMTIERDKNDRERKISPLIPAEDAWKIETTQISVDEVVAIIIEKIEALTVT